MGKWILILKLLAQDQATGEIDWVEAVRVENITFETCAAELVMIVNTLQDKGIQHDVYCQEIQVIKVERFHDNPVDTEQE